MDINDWVPVPNDVSSQTVVSQKVTDSCLGNNATLISSKKTSLRDISRQSPQDPAKSDANPCPIDHPPAKNGNDYNVQSPIPNDSSNQAKISQGNEGSGKDVTLIGKKTVYLEEKSRQTTKSTVTSKQNSTSIVHESSKNDLNTQAPLKKSKKTRFWCETCGIQLTSFSTFRLHKSSKSHLSLTIGKLLGKQTQLSGEEKKRCSEEETSMAPAKVMEPETTLKAEMNSSKEEADGLAGKSLADLESARKDYLLENRKRSYQTMITGATDVETEKENHELSTSEDTEDEASSNSSDVCEYGNCSGSEDSEDEFIPDEPRGHGLYRSVSPRRSAINATFARSQGFTAK